MDWPFLSPGTGDTVTPDVGPTADGTYQFPDAVQGPNQPVDAGGGLPGNYGQQVLDIFKNGVGYLLYKDQVKTFNSYKSYSATPGGLFVQGQNGQVKVAGVSTQTLILLAVAGVGLVLLLKKG